ncbi:hypothetical protein AC249_AIPGENE6478 [Exaiptasia diaphana]|nr:hypothetical protein AC249_AIPGENE6478 [Exaiptasia diaphana]
MKNTTNKDLLKCFLLLSQEVQNSELRIHVKTKDHPHILENVSSKNQIELPSKLREAMSWPTPTISDYELEKRIWQINWEMHILYRKDPDPRKQPNRLKPDADKDSNTSDYHFGLLESEIDRYIELARDGGWNKEDPVLSVFKWRYGRFRERIAESTQDIQAKFESHVMSKMRESSDNVTEMSNITNLSSVVAEQSLPSNQESNDFGSDQDAVVAEPDSTPDESTPDASTHVTELRRGEKYILWTEIMNPHLKRQ